MGRGLSELQRHILMTAGCQRRVYYADVLERYFGWKPAPRWGRTVRSLERYRKGDTTYDENGKRAVTADEIGMLKNPGSQHFSRRTIGEATYSKTMATLSRACLRLERRGLVKCLQGACSHWAGVEITDQGREWLSANSAANLPPS
jgi:hypothetical protein